MARGEPSNSCFHLISCIGCPGELEWVVLMGRLYNPDVFLSKGWVRETGGVLKVTRKLLLPTQCPWVVSTAGDVRAARHKFSPLVCLVLSCSGTVWCSTEQRTSRNDPRVMVSERRHVETSLESVILLQSKAD